MTYRKQHVQALNKEKPCAGTDVKKETAQASTEVKKETATEVKFVDAKQLVLRIYQG